MVRSILCFTSSVVGLLVIAVAAPEARAQHRGMSGQMFMTPGMAGMSNRLTTSAMTPAAMQSRMMMTPAMATTVTTNNQLRDLRLDARLSRDLRFDNLLGRNMGVGTWPGMWGLSGAVIPTTLGPVGGFPTNSGGATAAAAPTDAAKAALLQEQVTAERLANRRRAFDELRYEQDKTPTTAEALLARSRGDPPLPEVLSGQALNALLADLRSRSAGSGDDPFDALLPLDRTGLSHINLTRGTGNFALLKGDGRLAWPAALSGRETAGPRSRLSAGAADFVRQAATDGRLDQGVAGQMAVDAGWLRATLRRTAPVLSFQDYSDAKTFLQKLDDTIVALRQPDAVVQFNRERRLRAQTVLGLVKEMTDNGLQFAPAAAGGETAYLSLREAFAACDRAAVRQQAAR